MLVPPSSPRTLARLLIAAALVAPAARAQTAPGAAPARGVTSTDSASRAHEVRRGETLWALAEQYFGDAFRWPVIREANADRVADPHWIYPGQRLRIPAGSPAASRAAAPAATADSSVAVASPAAPADSGELLGPAFGFVQTPAKPAPAPALVHQPARAADTVTRSPIERLAAPYVAAKGVLRGAGVIVDGADIPAQRLRGTPRRLQLLDRIVLSLPAGARTDRGTVYVIATSGPAIGDGEVVVPRGLAVLDGGGTESLRTARLTRLFGLVEAGLPVIPVAADAQPSGTSPSGTQVVWVPGDASLPTLQAYVMLGRGAQDGVRVGDRFELVGDGRRTPEGASLPTVRVGVVRVVRVSADAATAIVEHHDQPAIAAGVEARPLPR